MASTVIITGASQGIGKATALLFASKGYDVVLAARQTERLEALGKEVRLLGRQAIAISTDVKNPDQVNNLVQRALAEFSNIDVLINNAGIYAIGAVEQFSLHDWHQIIDTNLWGYIHAIQAILPHFLERGQGTIVNVGSIGSKVPIPYQVPYIASKYAITGLTESLHSELKPKGIQVSGIYPNLIKSNLLERAIVRGKDQQEVKARYDLVEKALNTPVPDQPEDVAKAIWDAVEHQRSEVMVASAKASKAAYQLFPGLMQEIFRRTFTVKDQ